MKLDGKLAVVTGGGTGIGLGIVHAFAAEGCKVIICGRREEPLKEAANAWSGNGEILYHTCDVSCKESVKEFFDWVKETSGVPDILVNSAGTNIPNRTIAEMGQDQWDQVMAINASGSYYCMYEVLSEMRERKDGLIINISSTSGIRASALGGIAYSASKFAVAALGISAANEVAADNVKITNIYPGEVDTPILAKRPAAVTEEHRARMLKPESLGHLALSIALLPQGAHVPEVTIKPLLQEFM